MLVYQVLFSVTFQNDNIAVKPLHDALKLKTVCQKNRNSDVILSGLIQEYVLKVHVFVVHC